MDATKVALYQNHVRYNTKLRSDIKIWTQFFNGSESVVKKQKSYWEGGNENELVLCVGMDSLTGTVNWAQTFSWSGDKYFGKWIGRSNPYR